VAAVARPMAHLHRDWAHPAVPTPAPGLPCVDADPRWSVVAARIISSGPSQPPCGGARSFEAAGREGTATYGICDEPDARAGPARSVAGQGRATTVTARDRRTPGAPAAPLVLVGS
jgi:hypothetical protein